MLIILRVIARLGGRRGSSSFMRNKWTCMPRCSVHSVCCLKCLGWLQWSLKDELLVNPDEGQQQEEIDSLAGI